MGLAASGCKIALAVVTEPALMLALWLLVT